MGDVFAWSDSFCSRMVRGLGPRVAPVSEDVPAYRDAPIGRQVPIGAYVGVPLLASGFSERCAPSIRSRSRASSPTHSRWRSFSAIS